MDICVSSTGLIRLVYDENFDLSPLGTPSIQRASHVEPNVDGTWSAALAPVGGPLLGPFALRSSALTAEVVWLTANLHKLALSV